MSRFNIEWRAHEWLCDSKGIKPDELYHGSIQDEPTFIYKGHYGYEVKLLHGKSITFDKGQYRSLRDWEDGEVLVFGVNESKPRMVIPFSRLPSGGGEYMGVRICLRERGDSHNRAMIAFGMREKTELETMRGEIETKVLPQGDWADILLQAMYAMLCDVGLIRFSYANRMGVKHFTAECPYCNTDNIIEGRYRLYWMLECSYCKRKFVVKRRVSKS